MEFWNKSVSIRKLSVHLETIILKTSEKWLSNNYIIFIYTKIKLLLELMSLASIICLINSGGARISVLSKQFLKLSLAWLATCSVFVTLSIMFPAVLSSTFGNPVVEWNWAYNENRYSFNNEIIVKNWTNYVGDAIGETLRQGGEQNL